MARKKCSTIVHIQRKNGCESNEQDSIWQSDLHDSVEWKEQRQWYNGARNQIYPSVFLFWKVIGGLQIWEIMFNRDWLRQSDEDCLVMSNPKKCYLPKIENQIFVERRYVQLEGGQSESSVWRGFHIAVLSKTGFALRCPRDAVPLKLAVNESACNTSWPIGGRIFPGTLNVLLNSLRK
jgi:hypothetical protein